MFADFTLNRRVVLGDSKSHKSHTVAPGAAWQPKKKKPQLRGFFRQMVVDTLEGEIS